MAFIYSVLFSFLTVAPSKTSGPEYHPLVGYWEGELTHPGGYRDAYSFQLQLQKDGDQISGWSEVSNEQIFAEMEMMGTVFKNNLLILEDKRILEHQINSGMEWCMKRYQLILIQEGNQLRLEGDWQGETSFDACDPGRVVLFKKPLRA